MTLITTQEVKDILGITDTSKDSVINALIPRVEGFVKGYCKQDFTASDTDGNTIISDEGIAVGYPIASIIEGILNSAGKQGIQSETISRYAVTYLNDLPASTLKAA